MKKLGLLAIILAILLVANIVPKFEASSNVEWKFDEVKKHYYIEDLFDYADNRTYDSDIGLNVISVDHPDVILYFIFGDEDPQFVDPNSDNKLNSIYFKIADYNYYTIEIYSYNQSGFSKSMTIWNEKIYLFYEPVETIINGPKLITLEAGEELTSLEIISKFKAIAHTNLNDISHLLSIKSEDNGYSGNENKLGTYDMIIRAEDASFNFQIKVEDTTPPEIIGPPTITALKPLSTSYILSHYYAEDSFDGIVNIVVLENQFHGNESTPGRYNLKLQATDLSGNITIVDRTIIVQDGAAPVITGPSKIIKDKKDLLNVEDLVKRHFTAEDLLDGNVSGSIKIIENNYAGYGNITGIYRMVIEASDSAGNQSLKTFYIEVFDGLNNYYLIGNDEIYVSANQKLEHRDLLFILNKIYGRKIDSLPSNQFENYHYYDSNSTVISTSPYNVTLKVVKPDGVLERVNFKIFVVEPSYFGVEKEALGAESYAIMIGLTLVIGLGIYGIFKVRKKRKNRW